MRNGNKTVANLVVERKNLSMGLVVLFPIGVFKKGSSGIDLTLLHFSWI